MVIRQSSSQIIPRASQLIFQLTRGNSANILTILHERIDLTFRTGNAIPFVLIPAKISYTEI